MMQELKKVVFINGSPKMSSTSASDFLAGFGEGQMNSDTFQISRVNVRESITLKQCEKDFEAMLNADGLIFAFPLYIFCLPAILMRFLQDYYIYFNKNKDRSKKTKVYAIVNCGFPEADICGEAVRVMECFSKRIEADFGFGILMGGGGMISEGIKDAPFMKKTFNTLKDGFSVMSQDIKGDQTEPMNTLSIPLSFPRKIYFFMADKGWVSDASKNGLKKRELYRKPYLR